MRIEGERFFVTGGLGFIGRHLVRALVYRDATVVVLDRAGKAGALEDLVAAGRVRVMRGDLLTGDLAAAMRGSSAVVHLAASPDVRLTEERPQEVFENNVLATARLLEGVAAANIPRFGFASTSTVYGEPTVLPTPEDYAPLEPISLYGASKLAAEVLLRGHARSQPLTAVVWRLANVVGGGATHGVVYDLVRKLRANPRELEILGREPGTWKSYIHIDDTIEAILHAWSAVDEGVEAFNVGSEDAISVREIADRVCEGMGLSGVTYRWTGGVDGGGWKGDVRKMALAVDKLKACGWKPRRGSGDAISRAAAEIARA